MGSVIALEEKQPSDPACGNENDLRKEAASLASQLKVIPLLEGMGVVVPEMPPHREGDELFLMVLDSQKKSMMMQGFRQEEFATASELYRQQEVLYQDNENVQVVLVSVKSINQLRIAYPSYFLDSQRFVELVKKL